MLAINDRRSTTATPPVSAGKTLAITITQPSNNATVSGVVSLVAEVSSDVIGVQFYDGTRAIIPEITKPPYSVNWDTRNTTDGTHKINAVARNAGGKQATASITVGVVNVTTLPPGNPTPPAQSSPDNSPPVISFVTQSNTVYKERGSIEARASDDVGIYSVQFFLDGISLYPEFYSPPWIIDWETSRFANGYHTMTAVAKDRAGNKSTATIPIQISR